MKVEGSKLYILEIPKELEREEYIRLLAAIDESKRKKIMSFRRPDDRIRGLLADNLVRYLATSILGIDNKQIHYIYNKTGKPFIEGFPIFYFNVSHSEQYVICAISSHNIGCDIQKKKPCDITMGKYVFTNDEQQLVHNIDEFYKMWTLKEALLKAIGTGISDEGIKINMVKSGTISDVKYKDMEFHAQYFEELLENYSVSVWSESKEDCEVIPINYMTVFSALV